MVRTLFLASVLALTGCSTAYYAAMEKVGVHKRDILVDRVEEARDAQLESQQEFKDALDELSQFQIPWRRSAKPLRSFICTI